MSLAVLKATGEERCVLCMHTCIIYYKYQSYDNASAVLSHTPLLCRSTHNGSVRSHEDYFVRFYSITVLKTYSRLMTTPTKTTTFPSIWLQWGTLIYCMGMHVCNKSKRPAYPPSYFNLLLLLLLARSPWLHGYATGVLNSDHLVTIIITIMIIITIIMIITLVYYAFGGL